MEQIEAEKVHLVFTDPGMCTMFVCAAIKTGDHCLLNEIDKFCFCAILLFLKAYDQVFHYY